MKIKTLFSFALMLYSISGIASVAVRNEGPVPIACYLLTLNHQTVINDLDEITIIFPNDTTALINKANAWPAKLYCCNKNFKALDAAQELANTIHNICLAYNKNVNNKDRVIFENNNDWIRRPK